MQRSPAGRDGWVPEPIDTSEVDLSPQLYELVELLAEQVHNVWASKRLAEGWRYGSLRDERLKAHPCLVPYSDLPEAEKDYDRQTALQTLRAVKAFGYLVQPST